MQLTEQQEAILRIVQAVRAGQPVVPLLGAGISIEAGVPPLSEVTRYLAKTKAYIRYRVFTNRPPRTQEPAIRRDEILRGPVTNPLYREHPGDHLHEFGWPDPQVLNWSLWHWLYQLESGKSAPADFSKALDQVVDAEILDALRQIDEGAADLLSDTLGSKPGGNGRPRAVRPRGHALGSRRSVGAWRPFGSYWKILLSQLTRSSPDLVDTLFQRLTRNRTPATAHRYLAFLTPVLRLRLFLTINFDTLLEDALRIEGFRPTVYEVTDGLSLPHSKLVQSGLSVVKLHGGAYGLLVGDRLDSPLDEESRVRFREYLPENLILLALGIGGWDQRVLDMVELAQQRNGHVWWLHFEDHPPVPLQERFATRGQRGERGKRLSFPDWLHTVRVQDPGAFLRDLYSEYRDSHPSSNRPFQVCDLRPVLLRRGDAEPAVKQYQRFGGRLVIFEDDPDDYGLGAARCLANLVARHAATHLPVWVDVETKFTVEDVVVDIIQQLRRYDPGLPPEILVVERTSPRGLKGNYRKVIRRLFAALARGRYILAFNGVQSFGRPPTRHHFYEEHVGDLQRERKSFRAFLDELVTGIEPQVRQPGPTTERRMQENLGLLDSKLAFALDHPAHADRPSLRKVFLQGDEEQVTGSERIPGGECRRKEDFDLWKSPIWRERPEFVLLTAMRRRRSEVALHRLLPKYLDLRPRPDATAAGLEGSAGERTGEDHDLPSAAAAKAARERVKRELAALETAGYLWRLEGGDYWMSRKLRNDVYDAVRHRGAKVDDGDRLAQVRALATLVYVHRDLANYHHREIYVATQDVMSLLEEIYHRSSFLRHLKDIEDLAVAAPAVDVELKHWLDKLAAPPAGSDDRPDATGSAFEIPWSGARSIVASEPGGKLDREGMAAGRCRGLRALREVLQQEREALLSRVPSVTLQGWVNALKDDLAAIVPGSDSTASPWGNELQRERARLDEVLDDIRIEVLQDRMETAEIFELRFADLARLLGADATGEIESNAEQLALLSGRPGAEPAVDLWHFRGRVARSMVDLTRGLRRGVWAAGDDRERARLDKTLGQLLYIWLSRTGGRGDAAAMPAMPTPPELLDLKLAELRLAADQALSTQSPWKVKGGGPGALRHQQEAARRALALSDSALRILDAIQERELTLRSYFHSLKGRALYLSADPRGLDAELDRAYREFDLARAALSETTARERLALAVALLRQAECLMVHADAELTRWVYRANLERTRVETAERPRGGHPAAPEQGRPAATPRSDPLSSEARRKLSFAHHGPVAAPDAAGASRESREEVLLCLSLANWSPQRLSELESEARRGGDKGLALINTLGIMRSRLAAARELLGRVEGLLESSRKDVEWWACLFQLRVQLAVESLLLLLSEPTSAVGPTADPWSPRTAEDLLPRGRRQFIHHFQELLTQGLMAVRQGLDILLPGDSGRHDEWLRNDELLNHLLRLWVELMVCGAYATERAQGSRSVDILDDNRREDQMTADSCERWQQWRYLNWLAGLVSLPDCEELEQWFKARDWTIGPPSLASRGRALARMDLALATAPLDDSLYPVGTALESLRRVLLDPTV